HPVSGHQAAGAIDAIRGPHPRVEVNGSRTARLGWTRQVLHATSSSLTRRKTFDPATVPISFWRRDDVQAAVARRAVGQLLGLYLTAFPDCTQTQLALLTAHDRSDVSNFVRGTRDRPVSDIDVLARIADGLEMPDEARVLLGLAPADAAMSSI